MRILADERIIITKLEVRQLTFEAKARVNESSRLSSQTRQDGLGNDQDHGHAAHRHRAQILRRHVHVLLRKRRHRKRTHGQCHEPALLCEPPSRGHVQGTH